MKTNYYTWWCGFLMIVWIVVSTTIHVISHKSISLHHERPVALWSDCWWRISKTFSYSRYSTLIVVRLESYQTKIRDMCSKWSGVNWANWHTAVTRRVYDTTARGKVRLIFYSFSDFYSNMIFLWMKLELCEEKDQHNVIQQMATKSRQDSNEIGFRE